jgi:hypothetical protein
MQSLPFPELFVTRAITPVPAIRRPTSRIRQAQAEILQRWAVGTYDSSPIANSPGFYERSSKKIEKLDVFTRPTPYTIPRHVRDRMINKHASRRAAAVARIMLESDVVDK